jgi:hypothetical protein
MTKSVFRVLALTLCISAATAAATDQTIEIKCLLTPKQAAAFSKKADLKNKEPLIRTVCFFDTESLSLFEHTPKLILRSRYSDIETDTTVKVRDQNGEARGKDCEFDEVLGMEKVLSCSVTSTKEKKKQIKRANIGKDIKKIFSKEQESAAEAVFSQLNWQELRPYGPVKNIKVWKKIKVTGGPDVTVERWSLPAHGEKSARILFEVSTKVALSDETKVSKWLANAVGLNPQADQDSETKTRIVLEQFR